MRPFNMIFATHPYGAQRKATIEEVNPPEHGMPITAIAIDENNEGHILVGGSCIEWDTAAGDKGTLTFTKGGPTGGYWKFKKDR